MKTLMYQIILLLLPILVNAQNCYQDTAFLESCVVSRIIEPGMRIGFLDEYIEDADKTSPLFEYDALPQMINRSYLEENGLTCNKLKDLILTVTSIENVPGPNNRPFTFFTANGNDGKRYKYYISMATDPLRPSSSFLWGIYLVDEYEKFAQLINQTVYGNDHIWSEKDGNKFKHFYRKKYYPLKVTGLIPTRGGMTGCFFVRFKPENEEQEYYRYCENSDIFYSIFTLCDPKDSYKNIKNKDWKAIQDGFPKAGMNKEILELTLGKPDNISTYQTSKDEEELWYYRNVRGKSYQIVFNKDKVESISSSETNRR